MLTFTNELMCRNDKVNIFWIQFYYTWDVYYSMMVIEMAAAQKHTSNPLTTTYTTQQ